jgi:hypothetical protein
MYSTLNRLCNPSFRLARLARRKDDGLSTAAVPSLPLGPRRGECLEIPTLWEATRATPVITDTASRNSHK